MISIVVPVFNEQESLKTLWCEISQAMSNLDKASEIVFVDDGSTDSSLDLLKKIAKKDKAVRIFSFRKNQGKAEALNFGFQKAKGDIVVTLDADLQDRPDEIPKLLEKLKRGWDVVCGWRKERQDSLPKVFASRLFNSLAGFFWGLRLHDYNCGLKVLTREAAKSLRLYGGLHRFLPLLAYQQGFTVTEVPVSHEKRRFGSSKYGFSKLWTDLPDMFTMIFLTRYSSRPLHFFGVVGGILFVIGIIILGYLSFIWFQGQSIGRRPLLFLGMLLVLSGFQVFFTGFLADLIINLSQKKRTEPLLKYSSDK